MKAYFSCWFVALLSMVVLDAPWLAFMGSRFYAPHLGHLLGPSFAWQPAALFYLLYALGIAVLVVMPAHRAAASVGRTFFNGALLGMVAYGTYDLTNQATLRDWPVIVTVVDMIWGATLTGLTSVLSLRFSRRAS